MSAPMKKLRTSSIEIVIHTDHERRYQLPKSKLKPVMALLEAYEADVDSYSIPWEEMAAERIAKYSKPGLALRGARAKEGLTQVQLANKLGILQYNLSKMETGARPIGKKMAVRLEKLLGIDYRVFL